MTGTQRTKILVVGNGSVGVAAGGGHYINGHTGQLMLDLAAAGLKPAYMAAAETYEAHSNLLDFELRANGIASRLWRTRPFTRIPGSIAGVFSAVKKADHVYIFYPGKLGTLVAAVCKAWGKPYGLYVRGGKYAAGAAEKRTLDAAAYALTVSPSIQEDLANYCGHVDVIRPMIGLTLDDRFDRPPLTAPPDRWKLLFVGRIETDKGIRELIEAAQTLKSRGLAFSLRMVGGGPLYQELKTARENGTLPEEIALAGLISDQDALLKEYETADLMVFPSYHEGFPRVLYEAMIKALPIVTTMVGGIPGRMVDGENCIGMVPKSSDAIVQAIEMATQDLNLLNRLGACGQDTVSDVLTTHRSHHELILAQIGRSTPPRVEDDKVMPEAAR